MGGKFDNGGRFDLRLPYADQGYVSFSLAVLLAENMSIRSLARLHTNLSH